MAGYTRKFLLQAFASRYEILGPEAVKSQYEIAAKTYDLYGKDKYRQYASLDADAIREYKAKLKNV